MTHLLHPLMAIWMADQTSILDIKNQADFTGIHGNPLNTTLFSQRITFITTYAQKVLNITTNIQISTF
jgi:hypothetical protein